MSFATEFSTVAGSTADAFKTVWAAVNAPTKINIPATQAGVVSSGVGSAIQKQATAGSGISVQTILLGAAATVLGIAALIIGLGRHK